MTDTPEPIKTYALEEVAAMIMPSDDDPAATLRWLVNQIRTGRASAYKVRRQWRMTHEDVEDLIGRNRNPTPAKKQSGIEQPQGQSAASRNRRQPTTASPWLTAVEAAYYAKVSVATIREEVKKGELPASAVGRKGRHYRIAVADVDSWMRSNSYEPPP